MARGEVRYRLTLDSNLKEKSEEGAAALNKAGGAFLQTSEKAGKLADTVGRTATTLARSADSFGLPTQALRALDDVSDVAELGLSNLTKGMAGFNAASVGVAGAGFAIGTAIGSWINTFPQAQKAVDGLRDSLMSIAGMEDLVGQRMQAMNGIGQFQLDMAKKNAEAFETVKNRLLAQGKTIEQIAEMYNGKLTPAIKTSAQMAQELVEKHKAAVEAAKQHAQELAKQEEDAARLRDAVTKAGWSAEKEMMDDLKRRGEEAAKANIDRFEAELKARQESYEGMQDALREWADSQEREHQAEMGRIEEMHQHWMETASEIADAVNALADIFALFGVTTASVLGRAVVALQSFAQAGQAAVQSVIAFSSGNIFAGIGAGLSALGGIGKGIKSLFFGGQEEHKRVNDMRDDYIKAAGGLDVLNKHAHAAGITLDHMLNAKTVKDYQAAIEELTGALDLQGKATQELDAAAEKYGFTTQNMSDTMGGELLKNYELLNAAGFEHSEILKRMAPDFNEYIQTAIKAGQAIPENFRPIIEEMIKMGLLTDENGKAFGSLEEAGITFTESLSDGLKSLIEEIHKLVAALTGIPDHLPNYSGGGEEGANPPAHGGPRGGEDTEHFATGGWTPPGPERLAMVGSPSGEFHITGSDMKRLLRMGPMNGAGGGDQPIVVMMDGREVGRSVNNRNQGGYMPRKRPLRMLS